MGPGLDWTAHSTPRPGRALTHPVLVPPALFPGGRTALAHEYFKPLTTPPKVCCGLDRQRFSVDYVVLLVRAGPDHNESSCGFVLLPDIILHYSKTIRLHTDDDQLRQDFPTILPAQLMLNRPLVTYPALPFIARKGKANWHQSSRNWYRTCHSERDSARWKPPSTRQEQLTDLRGLPRRPSAISCPSKTFTEISVDDLVRLRLKLLK